MNRAWHATHRMPAKANLDQRIAWHLEHFAACDCRDLPEGIRRALQERGIPLPVRPDRALRQD